MGKFEVLRATKLKAVCACCQKRADYRFILRKEDSAFQKAVHFCEEHVPSELADEWNRNVCPDIKSAQIRKEEDNE